MTTATPLGEQLRTIGDLIPKAERRTAPGPKDRLRTSRSVRIKKPYLNCWRVMLENDGKLYSPWRGVLSMPGEKARCARPRCPGFGKCTHGIHAFSPGTPVNEVVGNLDRVREFAATRGYTASPVVAVIRLHSPWTDTHGDSGIRGSHYELIGPLLTNDPSTPARLTWTGQRVYYFPKLHPLVDQLIAAQPR